MRVLWTTSVSPLPLTDGNRHRHFHLLRERRARDHDVVLGVSRHKKARRAALGRLSDLGVDVRTIPHVRRPSRTSSRWELDVNRPASFLRTSRALAATVADAGRFDVAFWRSLGRSGGCKAPGHLGDCSTTRNVEGGPLPASLACRILPPRVSLRGYWIAREVRTVRAPLA